MPTGGSNYGSHSARRYVGFRQCRSLSLGSHFGPGEGRDGYFKIVSHGSANGSVGVRGAPPRLGWIFAMLTNCVIPLKLRPSLFLSLLR
jgi:hypothetical protein